MARVPTAKEYGLSTYPSGTRQATKLHNVDELALALYPTLRQNVFYFEDDFAGTLNTNFWTTTEDTSGTAFRWVAGQNGLIQATTHTDSGDGVGLRYNNATFSGDKNAGMEVIWSVDVVGTTLMLEMGFSSVITTLPNSCLNDIDTPSVTNGMADGAIFGLDTSQTLVTAALVGIRSGGGSTQKTVLSPVFSPTAGLTTFYTTRIQLVGNHAYCYVWDANGVLKGSAYLASAIEGGTAIIPYVNVTTVTTAAKNMNIDVIRLWQDR